MITQQRLCLETPKRIGGKPLKQGLAIKFKVTRSSFKEGITLLMVFYQSSIKEKYVLSQIEEKSNPTLIYTQRSVDIA